MARPRYVYGADAAPILRYEGPGSDRRRWLYTDERGSVIATADDGGQMTAINSYDEYGIPATANDGRFGYTGQAWNGSLGLWDYHARTYSPTLGRFLQTDPIGYGDGVNWYNYVGGDPVNNTDPSGLTTDEIVVTANRSGGGGSGGGGFSLGFEAPAFSFLPEGRGNDKGDTGPEIVVTAKKVVQTIQNHPYIATGIALGVGLAVCPECDAAEIIVTARRAGFFTRLFRSIFGRSACFAAGTLVQTDDGLRAIETIKPGDMVLSRDEKTGRTAYKRVTAVKTPTRDELYTVELDVPAEKTAEHHADFNATATHPWRTTDEHWMPTAQLHSGMTLVRADGAPARVEHVRDTNRKALTYNLTVEGYHTYFVGKDHIWVHNACDERPNYVQNRQAADARQQAERLTGERFTKAQQREFHDRITGESMGYEELVDEAIRVLTGN